MPNDCKIFFGAGPYSVGIGYPKLGFGFEHKLREDFLSIFLPYFIDLLMWSPPKLLQKLKKSSNI